MKKSLGRGAFDQRKGPHGGEFDQKKILNVKCPGVSPEGGGGWALLDLTHTLCMKLTVCTKMAALQTS